MEACGRIILASQSPRRMELLQQLGIQLEAIPSDIAEVGYGGDPALIPGRITKQKVKAVRARLGSGFDGWIIGADTVVALEQDVFGKPTGEADAKQILRRLAGKTHTVYTAFRIEAFDGDFREATVATAVEMAPMNESEIEWYVSTGEPMDKAGAYAIQGAGGAFVKSIRGSYSNVVGLPLLEVTTALRELGAIR